VKILLVDDHKIVRDGLRSILEKAAIEVVGEAASGREALALGLALRPDIVIMDITMPDLNGIDATRQMVADMPRIKVIGLSMNSDRRYVLAMFAAGAAGYLLKDSASEELIHALHTVAEGRKYVSPLIASIVLDDALDGVNPQPAASGKALSARERQVLQLVAEGKSSKEISGQLAISVTTVETHRRQIMDKLNLRTIAELTKYAIREGMTSLE